MNVYFTASVVGKRYHEAEYKKIIQSCLDLGHSVQAAHIMNTSEQDLKMESREQRVAFHQQLRDWISQADCMIVEASFPSISVGYEISLALHCGKPVLVLYCEGEAPNLLQSHQEDKIICELYQPRQVHTLLRDFFDYVRGTADTRFTFFLPADLALFLERQAKSHHQSKAAYLRELISRAKTSG